MATQMQQAREGKITEAMKIVAVDEKIDAEHCHLCKYQP